VERDVKAEIKVKSNKILCSLIDYIFFWRLLIMTTGKGILIEESYSDARSFILGFYIVTTGKLFLFLPMKQKKKNIKTFGNLIYSLTPRTNQIASSFHALPITRYARHFR
jgi:hypothetical protein